MAGCTTSQESTSCDNSDSVTLQYGGCLTFNTTNLSATDRNLMEQTIRQSYASVNSLMPVNDVNIKVIENPANTIPEQGIGGYNPSKNEVRIHIDVYSPFFLQSLANELAPTLAHELHHLKRRRAIGYGSSLLEAMVSEGLADHFSMETDNIDTPIWAAALDADELEIWTEEARKTWRQRPYDHNAWFFGVDSEIPRWAGYSIGFKLVDDYLKAHPDHLPSKLYGEPAESFIP